MIHLCLGIHNHQPVGNFDSVMETAYSRCYRPFLKLLENSPDIKITLHNTGILWRYFETIGNEYHELTKKLIARGQLELLGGGFYEPILPAIRDDHKKAQIKKLSDYLHAHFRLGPRGMWIAERVWEPQLASIIADCGLEYSILDDTHFRWAGLRPDQLNGYFITEDQGRLLCLFPISKKLRYLIPFGRVDDIIEYLKRQADEYPGSLAIYADDGEKFGIWPDTYRLCYEENWLERFFEAICRNGDWLKPISFGQALDLTEPVGRVYLPTASYAEMGQWALPAEGFRHYEELEKILKDADLFDKLGYLVRGGIWRNFMTKYPEANNMHKKMYRTAAKIDSLEKKAGAKDRKMLANAQDLLFQAQCNCPYWHGVFGGLYLNHLRYATYKRLIEAESICDRLEPTMRTGRIETTDFDGDGYPEILLETALTNAYFTPRLGGAMFELDLKDRSFNLLDTMTRRQEGYHYKLEQAQDAGSAAGKTIHDRVEVKESGLEKYLVYDKYRRLSFIDHFFRLDSKFEEFVDGTIGELGDFVEEPYAFEGSKTASKLTLLLTRTGQVNKGESAVTIELKKKISLALENGKIEANYTLQNLGEKEIVCLFGVELNWSLLAGDAADRFYYIDGADLNDVRLNSRGTTDNVSRFGLVDRYHDLNISIELSEPARLWRMPIETVSLSESGFERVYQSSVTCPCFEIGLKPARKHSLSIIISFLGIRN